MLSVIVSELNQKPVSLAYCNKAETEFSTDELGIVGAVTAAVQAPVDANFVENYFEGPVPLYSPTTFFSHFRMSRQTVQVIRRFKMSHNLNGAQTFRRQDVSPTDVSPTNFLIPRVQLFCACIEFRQFLLHDILRAWDIY